MGDIEVGAFDETVAQSDVAVPMMPFGVTWQQPDCYMAIIRTE